MVCTHIYSVTFSNFRASFALCKIRSYKHVRHASNCNVCNLERHFLHIDDSSKYLNFLCDSNLNFKIKILCKPVGLYLNFQNDVQNMIM